ncbi:SURF1 family protein [Noviherbaspirillum galbum]|uniref:SURF1-like protein n=1 Tax=Noviherbaspirillum galbum TaxID=2709383 RepID=A0A6B3SXL3_9BURK|nr:SURF1 family protein [Noviherbaspirillum galbum]NEX64315.1 SURF1 family protein [Noviherbaspirillum galbum]
MAFTFRFRPLPFVAAILAVALGVSLGQWQTRRAHEKEAIERRLQERTAAPAVDLNNATPDAESGEYRRATVRGRFLPDWTVYLDNRPHEGMAGFYVLTPFQIAGSDRILLVARGWVRRDPMERTRLPAIPLPPGDISLQGLIRRSAGHVMELGKPELPKPGGIVQNLDPQGFAQASKLNVLPVVLEQTSDAPDGLVRDWPRPSLGVDKHRGYAFQWYALAATAFVFYLVTGFRRGRSSA